VLGTKKYGIDKNGFYDTGAGFEAGPREVFIFFMERPLPAFPDFIDAIPLNAYTAFSEGGLGKTAL